MENAEEYAKVPRPRKRKVIFSKEQTACLEGVFKVSRYPDITVIESLAQDIGVAMEKISNWFQNKRAREKRNQAADHRKWMKEQFYQSQAAIHAQGDHVISPRQSQSGVYGNGQSPYGSYDRKPSIMDAFQYELNGSACRYPPQMPPMPLAPLLPHNPIVPSSLSPTLPDYSKHYATTNLASVMTSQFQKAYVPPSLSPTVDYTRLYGQQDYQSTRSPGMALPHDPTMTSPASHVDVTSPLTSRDPRSPQSEMSENLSPECSTPAVIKSYGGGRPHWPVSPLSVTTSPEHHEPTAYRPVFVHPDYVQTSRTSPITSLPSPSLASLPGLHVPTSLAGLGLPFPSNFSSSLANSTSPYASLTSSIPPLPTLPTSLASMSMPFPTTTTTTTTTSNLSPLPVDATSYTTRTPSTSLPNSYWYNGATSNDFLNANSPHSLAADMNYYYQQSMHNYHHQPAASLRPYDAANGSYPPTTSSLSYPSPTNQTPSYMGQCHIPPY